MEAVVTNVWSKVKRDDLLKAEVSRVVVDSTAPADARVRRGRAGVTLQLEGISLNMPEASIDVLDGLVTSVAVHGPGVVVEVGLAHPVEPRLVLVPGLPSRTVLEFDRAPLRDTFTGRRVVVDPGHGGRDSGGRGPIDLLEKDLVLEIAGRLAGLLRDAGAEVLLTRTADEEVVTAERRCRAEAFAPDLIISVHLNWAADRHVKGTRTGYVTAGARRLAALMQGELVRKLKLPDLGIHAWEQEDAFPGLPAAYVECVTISNPVEEGWLRGCTFLQRCAQGIFNGAQAYLLSR